MLNTERGSLIFGIGVLIAVLFPQLSAFDIRVLGAFAIYFVWVTLAVSWNLVAGFAGLFNLGLVAFFGLGAVVGAAGLQAGYPVPAIIIVSGLSGVFLAVVLIPTFRLKGLYFAAASFIIPYMAKPLVEVLGGKSTYSVPGASMLSPEGLYYTGLVLATLAVLGVYGMMQSRLGLALRALGDDEVASASLGVDTVRYKTAALMVSGFLAAVAGLYYAEIGGTVETSIFQNLDFSLLPVFMVVIGGIGTFSGPVVGALLFSALDYYVTSQFPGSTIDTFVLSLSIVVIAIFRPRGLMWGWGKA